MKYPTVLNEFETMRRVCAGASIARYGDGELKMAAHNTGIKSQAASAKLSARLRAILKESGDCLVGIPNVRGVLESHESCDQKIQHWTKYLSFWQHLSPRAYVSAFISRPDSAPWIDTDAYWAMVESLWVGHDVTVVGGSGKSLKPEDLDGAGEVRHIPCPRQHAWAEYDEILERIGTPKRALICLGPTATVLAVDLCSRGVHAVDLGHIAMFLRKRRRGEPLIVNDEDRAHDRVAVPA